ncbi:hypothetical protein M406DRAFT_109014 [Cryphonectria parasitica EP155]|uniref:Uncharacterized protein n=1 Tax=Cryphonectria parasitica (strain ATCC 38755 / EP155) TaxID=660469 RepID=A0A9P4XZQ1_CRYP1|nr:uncharacterized protein M406DRAFT_109014 [Cryphonectria parasitica EP155]KAF3763750.1 hypothetical protein M406DRAFT_109014 [Cryphonectria parasitica EP155]
MGAFLVTHDNGGGRTAGWCNKMLWTGSCNFENPAATEQTQDAEQGTSKTTPGPRDKVVVVMSRLYLALSRVSIGEDGVQRRVDAGRVGPGQHGAGQGGQGSQKGGGDSRGDVIEVRLDGGLELLGDRVSTAHSRAKRWTELPSDKPG